MGASTLAASAETRRLGVVGRMRPQDLETVRVALEMGYYQSPRRCTMEDIAGAVGITKSAVYHRMSKVEREAVSVLLVRLGVPPKGNGHGKHVE